MGFGSFFKDVVKDVSNVATLGATSGNFGDIGSVGTSVFGGTTISGLLDVNKDREEQGLAPLTQEQLNASNVFQNLTKQQQADLLVNNPNIITAQGSQSFDPLTNTIRLEESEFQTGQRGRQEDLARGLTGQLVGTQLPGTDPSARFEEGRQLFQPEFQEQRSRLEQQLADKGIPLGSEAANKELNRLEQSQGRQLRQLAQESVATSEAQRAARFNEISSLLGQQQVGGVGFGQFQPQSSGLDLFGAEQAALGRQFQSEQASADRKAAQRAALIGSLGSLGGAGIAALSDSRLKENIEEVGVSNSGIPIYEFDYINKAHGLGRFSGVMAQDLLVDHSDAVITLEDGIMAVDYDLIDVNFVKV